MKPTTSKIELIPREEGNSPPMEVLSQRRVYPVVIKRREASGEGNANRMKKVLKAITNQRERQPDREVEMARKFVRGAVRSSMAHPSMAIRSSMGHPPKAVITRNSGLNKDLEILESYQVSPAVKRSINLPASRNVPAPLTARS